MTDAAALRAEAASARATAYAAANGRGAAVPDGKPLRENLRFGTQLRAERVTRDGQEFHLIEGYASVFERGYEMWDAFGPYTEVVSSGAADRTLASKPFVVFRFNHGGTSMANTRNGRLELWADSTGLGDRAWVNPKRADVELLIRAMEDEDVTEQSFMFMIESGRWSPDYSEYRIDDFELDRGDVGPVTLGANPHTSIAARAGEILAAIPQLPRLAAREAYQMLSLRTDLVPDVAPAPDPEPGVPTERGTSIALVTARLLVESDTD